jgi:hypothetical protein
MVEGSEEVPRRGATDRLAGNRSDPAETGSLLTVPA